jgi:hypothetical protein
MTFQVTGSPADIIEFIHLVGGNPSIEAKLSLISKQLESARMNQAEELTLLQTIATTASTISD